MKLLYFLFPEDVANYILSFDERYNIRSGVAICKISHRNVYYRIIDKLPHVIPVIGHQRFYKNDAEQLNVNFTGRRIIARMNVKFNNRKLYGTDKNGNNTFYYMECYYRLVREVYNIFLNGAKTELKVRTFFDKYDNSEIQPTLLNTVIFENS